MLGDSGPASVWRAARRRRPTGAGPRQFIFDCVDIRDFMAHLLFRPAAACSRAHPASSVSFVAFSARLALGNHKGNAKLAPDFVVRWRRLDHFRRAALQVGAGQVVRWFGDVRHAGLESGSPMQKADSRSASICSSAICEVSNIYDFQGEQVRRWVGVLPQVPGMGALAFTMRNDSGRILLKNELGNDYTPNTVFTTSAHEYFLVCSAQL